MRIVLDFRKYDGVVGGVEQGAINIARNMIAGGHGVVLVCKAHREDKVRELFAGVRGLKIMPLPVKSHAMTAENARIDSGMLQDIAVEEGADLIHFFYNWGFPSRKKVPCVVTIHDVIPFTFREAMGFWRNLLVYRRGIKRACRLNDAIATVSEFSKQDISQKVGVPLDKITVIPNGLREPSGPNPKLEAELERRHGLQRGFILNVGGIHERKNIPRLIHAFGGLIAGPGYDGDLVITGSVSGAPYQEKMKKICDAAVTEWGVANRVIFTGFIPDDELDVLVRRADLLVYPSLYEGFGIPILEAMKADTPVVTSNVTAMPEVAGEAAVMVDPLDADALTDAMSRVAKDAELRQKLIQAGRRRAAGYSWERNGREYLDLYKRVTGGQ